jgi:hypothetical protein
MSTLPIAQRLLTIEGISLLMFEDEEMIKSAFSKNNVHYADSFFYLLRASHGDSGVSGFKYVSSDTIAIIGYRNTGIYITPVADRTEGKELHELCQKIANLTECRIILKKFSQKIYPHLKQIMPYSFHSNEIEDDICPERILTLPKLFTQQGDITSIASKFRKGIKRFENLGISLDVINDVTQVSQCEIELFLKKDPQKHASYLPIVTYLYTKVPNTRYKSMLFFYKNVIQGLYIADILSQKDIGLYCAVNAKEYGGSTEWMDWYFFRKMFLDGIQTIYFGGAETQGVDNYIKKLLPDKAQYSVTTVQYMPSGVEI